jgi:GNAT superfamily N-acetyltransferase
VNSIFYSEEAGAKGWPFPCTPNPCRTCLRLAPDQRGQGVGALLFERFEWEVDRLGIKDVIVDALPANTEVLDLYHRRGFEPTWLVMTRFSGRRKP